MTTSPRARDLLIRRLYAQRSVLLDVQDKRDLTHDESCRLAEIERAIDENELAERQELLR